MREMARMLMIAGGILLVAGALMTLFGKTGLGRLPGDIVVRRANFTLYFPLVTSLLISVVLSLILWLFRK